MTLDEHPSESPATYVVAAPVKPVWYRRTSVLVAAVVAAFVVASVLVDLPAHTDHRSDVANQTSVMQQINDELAGCAYAVHESVIIDQKTSAGTLTSSEKSLVPGMLRDDQSACSFTSSSIYDLSNVEGTGTPAGKKVGDIVEIATEWATADADALIQNLQSIESGSATSATTRAITTEVTMLNADRATAFGDLRAAERILNATLPSPDMPLVPPLSAS